MTVAHRDLDFIQRTGLFQFEYGSTRSCFQFIILNDEEEECNELFGFEVFIEATKTDERRTKLTRAHSQVIINETCMCVWNCGLKACTLFIVISVHPAVSPSYKCYADARVKLEETEYEVDEDEGHVEICAIITTPCSECPPLDGFFTLSIIPGTATG